MISHGEWLLSPGDEYVKKIQDIFNETGPFGLVPSEKIETFRDSLQPYASGLEILYASSDLKLARFDTDYTKPNPAEIVLPDGSVRIQLGDILRAKALVAMLDGDPDSAYRTLRILFRYSDWILQETPFLFSTLHATQIAINACDTMHQLLIMLPPAQKDRQSLREEIAQFQKRLEAVDLLTIETAFQNSIYLAALAGQITGQYNPYWLHPILNPIIQVNRAIMFDFFMRVRRDTHSIVSNANWAGMEKTVPGWAIMVRTMTLNVIASLITQKRGATFLRESQIALLLMEEKDKNGKYPPRLSDLSGLSNDLLLDPFSAQSFFYTSNGNSFTIYSIGPDGSDDRGIMKGDIRMRTYEGDFVWQMP